mgnify:CR=1 FL=1
MKIARKICFILLVLMLSIITFYTFNLVFSLVSNYASLSATTISCIPMFMFWLICLMFLYVLFNFVIYKRRDAYFVRKYSLTIGIMSFIGLVFSILCGTVTYHTFFGDYVFLAYPFVMLIAHALLLGISLYYFIPAIRDIKEKNLENKFKSPKFYWLRELIFGLILTFALEKLGAFLLMPIYFSNVDGIYVLPYLFQLLIPALAFITFMIHEHWLHNRKVTIILSSIAFGYTLLSFIYMIVLSVGRYPLTITPLSPIQQLERLTTLPIDFVLLYGVSFLMPGLNLGNNIIMTIKEKRKSKESK